MDVLDELNYLPEIYWRLISVRQDTASVLQSLRMFGKGNIGSIVVGCRYMMVERTCALHN